MTSLSISLSSYAVRFAGALLIASALLAAIPDAHAQRAFAKRFPSPAAQPVTVKGDITLIGNHTLGCSGTSGSTGASCSAVLSGTANGRNNDFAAVAVNVDSDGGANANSSSATLSVPGGSTVLFAGLYWSGSTAATAAARTTVRLRAPAGGYQTVTASVTDAIGAAYQSFADVTTTVAAAGSGQYTVANVAQATSGSGHWGGWTLVVAYQNPAGTLRNLTVFDGFILGNGTPAYQDISISGFYTPISGAVNTNLGIVAYDGDQNQSDGGNSLEFGATTASLTPVSNAVNPVNDVFNSTVSFEGAHVTAGRTPASVNTLGIDIDNLKPNTPLPYGSTTAVLRVRATSGDVNYPGVVTLATDAFEPEIVTSFSKSAIDDDGTFRPGDTVTYSISLTNQGNDNANQTVVTDPLPAGVTYVPGSLQVVSGANAGAKTDAPGDDQGDYDAATRTITFRVGTSATSAAGGTIAPAAGTEVRFQVVIDAVQPHGANLANVAEVDYVSATSGANGGGSTPPSTFTVTRNADLSISKTGPATVATGGGVAYVVTVRSVGPEAADGAMVTDDVPDAVTGVSIACAASGGAVCPATAGLTDLSALAIPTFPSGGQVVFTITGTAPNAPTTLSNSASVAPPAGTNDPTPGDNSAGPVVTGVVSSADLSIVKTLLTPGPYRRAQALQYSIVVTNAGPSTATGVQITDTPTNLTITSVSGGGCAALPCTIASIASGATVTLTVNATIDAAGPFDNAATVSSDVSDPAPADNSDPSGNGGTAVESADLSVDKTVAAGPHYPGQNLVYTIVVANAGPSTAADASLADTLPAGTTFVSLATPAGWSAVTPAVGAGGTITATHPALASGASATFTLTAAVSAAAADGTTIANTAGISSATEDPSGANDASTATATITASADVTLAKTLMTPGPYIPGQAVTYSIIITNAGPSTATGVQVSDTPTNLTVTAVSGAGCAALPCALGSLASGATATITVVATIDAPGAFDNAATVTATTSDPTPGNNTDPGGNGGTAVPLADLSVAKTRTSASPATTGSAVTYQIVATNNGPSAVAGAALADTVPPQLTGVTWTCAPAPACPVAGGSGDVDVSLALAVGGAATVTVTGTAPATTPSTIAANTATIAPPAGTVDPTPASNSSTSPAIPVAARPIDAVSDAGTVGGTAGGTAVASALGNDTFDGAPATLAGVTISVVTPAISAGVVLDPATGAVTVAAGTPAGTYTITYRICEQLNPTNCDTAAVTITVLPAELVAQDDAGTIGGAFGGTPIPSVLANDSVDGTAATPANVTISVLAPASNPGVALNPATGTIDVAAGTPAGTYTITYRICEQLNPANCDDAIATVAVTAATLVANDDTGSAGGAAGGQAIASVLGNDSVNGAPATAANVVVSQLSSTSPNVTLDPATAAVNVAAGTPAGTYTIAYRICETLNPANCTAATATVTVTAAAIIASDDSGTPVTGASGGTAIGSVLGNDTLGGAAATPAAVTLSVVSPAADAGVMLDPATGAVIVAAGTPAGTYTIAYRICEQLNPSNCDTAIATVRVTAAAIIANDDNGAPVTGAGGGSAVANVLGNDTLGAAAASTTNVTLSVVTAATDPGVVLDPATGAVSVAAGTPAGTYTIMYRICERLNPGNCDTAAVTVNVTAATIVARDDASPPISGAAGGTAIASVLGNDAVGGAPATPAIVTVSLVSPAPDPGVALDPATGSVAVAAGTPAGTYAITYRICEQLNPANCDVATATVTVAAAAMVANDDTAGPVEGGTGADNVANVFANDTLDGAPANPGNVVLTQVAVSGPGIVLDPATGAVSIPAGTPAGTYTLTYRICERLNPDNCDTATVTVNVVAPALVAVDDAAGTRQNTAVMIAALGNDTLDGAGVAVARAVLTIVAAPANGSVTVNADGTLAYVPASNFSGTDAFTYRLCDRINPTVCDDAVVTLAVSPNTVDAIDQAVAGPQTAPVRIDVIGTTRTGGGAPLDPGSVRIVSAPVNGTVAVNPDGSIAYTPNRLFIGIETFTFRVCDTSRPTPVCDVATVTVTVQAQAPQLRVSKTAPPRAVKPGDLVRYTVVVENVGISPASGVLLVDTPPAGFTFVEGSLSVDDDDDAFVLASADPLRIAAVDVGVGRRATVVYLLRVGAGTGRGTHVNRVVATDATGTGISNVATADVVVEGDPLLEDSLVLGTVFEDLDRDGAQQAGEPGLPGVRIASVEGLLMETDQHGRYHLIGIDAQNALRGRNFILKVDASTLPPGTTFTSANPLVRRITPGIPVRFDFGVELPSDDAQSGNATR